MISIRDLLHAYAATLNKTWAHDRSKTVGASEIGQCARKVFFDKRGYPADADYVPSWGALLRGIVMEEAYWAPALRQELPKIGLQLLFAGKEQETLFDGYLSATTDGLIVDPATGECINIDCKTFDPRVSVSEGKPEHSFQTQVQAGLIRDKTKYKPTESILSYINASFWDDIREPRIQFSPRIYKAAQIRAEQIMTATDPLELPPEGKMAGGDECKYCAWASRCAEVTVAGVPKADSKLDEDAVHELWMLRNIERHWATEEEECGKAHAEATEAIKKFLRENNTRKYQGDGWSVSYYSISGREMLDIQAVEAAGIDLSKFKKTGKQAEVLRVK